MEKKLFKTVLFPIQKKKIKEGFVECLVTEWKLFVLFE